MSESSFTFPGLWASETEDCFVSYWQHSASVTFQTEVFHELSIAIAVWYGIWRPWKITVSNNQNISQKPLVNEINILEDDTLKRFLTGVWKY